MAKKGVWGERMTIITPVLYKRVTCATCRYYCHEDYSCMISPIIPKINGFDYWKKCKKFELSPDYNDKAHKMQVMKVKGTHFFEQFNKEVNPKASVENVETTVKGRFTELTIEKHYSGKRKSFSDCFVEMVRKNHQMELVEISMPALPGMNSTKCFLNNTEKLVVMTMPKIKSKKIYIHQHMSKNMILADKWSRFLESLRATIKMLDDLNASAEYEKWIVLPVFPYTDDESCGEVFYKTRGRELKGIKLVEMDEDGKLLFATGPVHEKYWTAEKINNVKVFKEA